MRLKTLVFYTIYLFLLFFSSLESENVIAAKRCINVPQISVQICQINLGNFMILMRVKLRASELPKIYFFDRAILIIFSLYSTTKE